MTTLSRSIRQLQRLTKRLTAVIQDFEKHVGGRGPQGGRGGGKHGGGHHHKRHHRKHHKGHGGGGYQ